MKAFVVDHYGTDGLCAADVPEPDVGDGDVFTSSIATAESVSTTSARATTRRPSERSRGSWASTRTPSALKPTGSTRPPTGTPSGPGRPTSATAAGLAARPRRRGWRSITERCPATGRRRTSPPNSAPPAARSRSGSTRATSTDGHLPGHDHGIDVDESGEGTLDEPRMYQLVRQRGGAADCTFEITFEEPGVRAYVFTFG
jgi:hypothetical protein